MQVSCSAILYLSYWYRILWLISCGKNFTNLYQLFLNLTSIWDPAHEELRLISDSEYSAVYCFAKSFWIYTELFCNDVTRLYLRTHCMMLDKILQCFYSIVSINDFFCTLHECRNMVFKKQENGFLVIHNPSIKRSSQNRMSTSRSFWSSMYLLRFSGHLPTIRFISHARRWNRKIKSSGEATDTRQKMLHPLGSCCRSREMQIWIICNIFIGGYWAFIHM